MKEWKRFVQQLRARTSDEVLLWSVDLADALTRRMSMMRKERALAVAAVVFRGMGEALHLDPVELFGLLVEEGYMGGVDLTVVHVVNPECDCPRCREAMADEANPKEMN